MFFLGYIINDATCTPLAYVHMTTEVKFPLTTSQIPMALLLHLLLILLLLLLLLLLRSSS